jgi:hypothetical protein
VALKATQTVAVKSCPLGVPMWVYLQGRSRVSLQCLKWPKPPTLPIEYTVRGGGNLVYYIKTPLYNISNKTLTRAGGDKAAFG